MDSNQVTNCAESSSDIFNETPQVQTNIPPAAPTLNTRYYSVMDDEGADDVFIHPTSLPTTCLVPSVPAEGSPGTTDSNSGVTLSNGAADATEAEANPRGLDRHETEKQLMAARNKTDEVILRTEQPSRESMDNILPSNDKDSTPPAYQEQTSTDDNVCLMEASDEAGKQFEDNISGDQGSDGEPEDILILSEGDESCEETDTEEDNYPQKPSNLKENEACQDKEESETKHKDICCHGERDSKLSRDDLDCVEKMAPTLPGRGVNQGDFQASEPSVISESKQDTIELTTNQPQVADFSAEVINDSEGQIESRSLDYTLTKFLWVRRESGSTETQVTQLPTSEDSEKMVEKVDGSRRIVTDIQQGEQLLQRLQMVQLRHEEIPNESQKVVKVVRSEKEVGFEDRKVRGRSVPDEDDEDGRFQDKANTNLMVDNKNESNQVQAKAGISLITMPGQTEPKEITRTEASDSEDDQSDHLIPSDLPLNPHEASSTEIPSLSTGQRFSAAETSTERQIHEAAQGKPNLQRADGIFNLAGNPDVLEIPFKTNVSLESLLTKACTSQHTQWQFSEKKMQKEISQEIQRELVLVNQGKIPGEYSKGEVRQLKETKLLFEAFQQGNSEGLTRHLKPPVTVVKDQVYPSVLERTRSLEMFTLKSSPVSRTHSLRLFNPATSERDKSPENFRPKSPTGGTRDKTRLSPYPKQDKHLRLHRSMDSINSEATISAVETRSKTTEANKSQESPILKQNPFFKLRPALALQPEVAKDIREAREREEELRRQRSTLYGVCRQNSEDEEKSRCALTPKSDFRLQARGKLERVWPPPSKKDQKTSEQTQDPKVHRTGGQKAQLWQRWECGLINGQASKEKK
ncbi:uncharacterized protein LOC121634383 isoform X2 [Melanotaenia boesemani]|uniref:uncharacterized protein LOC121634383 isoform X2 n=1 Tax=Melanotaenia boesemani TaxID=1250792 RepID=UPI001C045ED9|nr:uncharacterized protein LOC121634383 isoform X2 [Melanotaenia boesemani]